MSELPSTIGRYEILEILGRGAMGVVYRAKDPLIGRIVAIKVISPAKELNEEQRKKYLERFFQEARAAGRLKHPGIVAVYDVGEEGGIPFMALEFLEGITLTDLIRSKGHMPAKEAVSIVRQVADALGCAHGQEVVHRDIKPDNIIVDSDGRAFVTDFGVARLEESELTRQGEILGTPHYMSPEQITGKPVDGRSDLFSLGIVLYQLLTGKRPFQADSVASVIHRIVETPPDPIPEGMRFPHGMRPILERMLVKDPEERYSGSTDLIADLDAVLPPTLATVTTYATQPIRIDTGTGTSPSIPPGSLDETLPLKKDEPQPPRKEKPKKKKRRWLLWTLLVILGLCLICAVLGPERERREQEKQALEEAEAAAAVPLETPEETAEEPEDPAPEEVEPVKKTPKPPPPRKKTTQSQKKTAPPPKKTAEINVLFLTRFNTGKLTAFVDDKPVWEAEIQHNVVLKGTDLARMEKSLTVTAEEHHKLRFTVDGPNDFHIEGKRNVYLKLGEKWLLKVEAKRFPKRIKIERM